MRKLSGNETSELWEAELSRSNYNELFSVIASAKQLVFETPAWEVAIDNNDLTCRLLNSGNGVEYRTNETELTLHWGAKFTFRKATRSGAINYIRFNRS